MIDGGMLPGAFQGEMEEILNSLPGGLGVYRYDRGKIAPVFHNPAFYEIMGYSDEEISEIERDTGYLGVHPEDLRLLKNKISDAVRINGTVSHTYRIFHTKKREYRWIRLDGTVKSSADGTKMLYGLYSDVSEQVSLEKELAKANEKVQGIINAIPGGVAIYKVSDIFETVYFSDGVAQLTGYSVEEYRELVKGDAARLTYPEDSDMVVRKVREAIKSHSVLDMEFRKSHRDGHIVWVHMQAKEIGEENGCPLLQCVFHNITSLKETQLEMDHLLNSIPGGIAIYQVEGTRFNVIFFSDGVVELSGHTREEYDEMVKGDALDLICEMDRKRVLKAAEIAVKTGELLDISYRIYHKDGRLVWVHLNGRRMGPLSGTPRFYAVFTGMSAETRLFQSMANEAADGVYVIERDNYELLYANESVPIFMDGRKYEGHKCYEVLQGRHEPCAFCTLKSHKPDGLEHEMKTGSPDRALSTHFREMDWNGIPAYIKYIRDVTEETRAKKEKERLEQYFQTVVKNIPDGIAVIRSEGDKLVPEFISEGFASMAGMTVDEAWEAYRRDPLVGVHPDDRKYVCEQMLEQTKDGEDTREIIYRLMKKDGSSWWVKNTLSRFQGESGGIKLYAVYHDITNEVRERENLRQSYRDLLIQHYQAPEPNTVLLGHCNVTRNKIAEISGPIGEELQNEIKNGREAFFYAFSEMIEDSGDRQIFLEKFLNKPLLEAFQREETEVRQQCFIRFPGEDKGRYLQSKVNLVMTPDTGDVTGIFTVTDVTEAVIRDRIVNRLSVSGYDFVADVDLLNDTYTILNYNRNTDDIPPRFGGHQERMKIASSTLVVPRDREYYLQELKTDYMMERLKREEAYSFSFSLINNKGEIRTKNMMVTAIDLRLGRVCLTRADITESVREQQGLFHMIAYTFDLAGFLNPQTEKLILHTRRTVLENLPPYFVENYSESVPKFTELFGAVEDEKEVANQFQLKTMLQRLEEKPGGYDFIMSCQNEGGLRYKQVNVLWGDENHQTICLVRADVTDMLMEERKNKKELEKALTAAQEASRAKSNFLSAMSHDIRTPMNAIMGMTTLAAASLDDRERMEDCLKKIMVSSRHLLSLINDVLDMSKIEHSKITLNRSELSVTSVVSGVASIIAPQAEAAGLHFIVDKAGVEREWFYGDGLRINQILINILGNAVKFTPRGGTVTLKIEEMSPVQGEDRVRYRFTVSDTGIGMPEELLSHIFEPFIRNRDSIADRIEGTGLGLSITKGLTEQMGGTITARSQVNQGTVFQVELEFDIAEQTDCAGECEEQPESGNHGEKEEVFKGKCFLLAEDNQINAEIVSELLKLHGAQVVVRPNGLQAVEEFGRAKPGTYDVILMDIQMPVMNGYDAARAIRELPRADAGTIPVIAMTANAFTEDVEAAMTAGMNAHVAKPVDMEILRETLWKVLNRK